MKRVKFLAMLLAAGMFAACSDNLDDTGSGSVGGTSDKGYIRVALNLPTTSGVNSRGITNDDFDDGEATEYAVNDAILVLFTGTTEADANYSQAFNITPSLQSKPSDNITTRYTTASIEIDKPATGSVYGLVILNDNGLFQVVEGTTAGKYDKLQWKTAPDAVEFTDFFGKLAALNQVAYTIDDVSKIKTHGFLMTNAPKASVKGTTTPLTGQNVTTLVQLTVRNNKDAADAAAPDEIYVERAVAKTTVKVNGSDNTLTVTDGDFENATVQFEGWSLNTTNKITYLVRNVTGWNTWADYTMPTGATAGSGNRFFGNDDAFYRVYWAIDPNYSTKDVANLSTYDADATVTWNGFSTSSVDVPSYCLENTTDVGNMQETELTGVLFKAKFKPEGADANTNLFMLANKSEIYTETNFINLVNTILGAGTITTITGNAGTYNDKASVASLLGIDETKAGILLRNSLINGEIKFYKGGVCYYYSTFIKHFGDELTPYSDTDGDYTAPNHLGRYGVVRNNWYELTVNKVTGPGSPQIPEPDEGVTPDTPESWIRCAINVLSWAKRSQNVEL